MKNVSKYPCPICRDLMVIVGENDKGKKLGSCGCQFSFKKTKSQKDMDNKYIKTPWGLERIK